jgi:hypothetical protein
MLSFAAMKSKRDACVALQYRRNDASHLKCEAETFSTIGWQSIAFQSRTSQVSGRGKWTRRPYNQRGE